MGVLDTIGKLGVGGALVGAAGNMLGQAQAQKFSARQAELSYQRERDLDEWLGKNQVQWRVQDLNNAGLNPVLAAGAGFGGGMTTQQAPQAQSPGSQQYGTAALQGAASAAQISAITAQARLANAQANKTTNETPDPFILLDDNGNPDWSRMPQTLGNLSAWQTTQQIHQAQNTTDLIAQQLKTQKATTSLEQARAALAELDRSIVEKTMQWTVQKAKAELGIAEGEAASAEATRKIMESPAGVWLRAGQMLLGSSPLATALGAAAGAFRKPDQGHETWSETHGPNGSTYSSGGRRPIK